MNVRSVAQQLANHAVVSTLTGHEQWRPTVLGQGSQVDTFTIESVPLDPTGVGEKNEEESERI